MTAPGRSEARPGRRTGRGRQKLLCVECDDELRAFVTGVLEQTGREALSAASAEDALRILREEDVALLVSDIYLRGTDGMELLRRVHEASRDTQVILTGLGTPVKIVVQAMRTGAFAFIEKPIDPEYLLEIVGRAHDERARKRDTRALKRITNLREGVPEIVSDSEAMAEVIKTAELVAPTDLTVLVEGESGVGKELVANLIHRRSERKEKPFIAINCGVLQENLLESELFGHERGAFTGAITDHQGLFEIADGGTLFLDEIGEMGVDLQVKLLRVLETSEFRRVGGHRVIRVDVRVITATNKKLAEESKNGNFREDLYYRLNVIHIEVPPLRHRLTDVPLLVQSLLARNRRRGLPSKDFANETMMRMCDYHWPGNVRELANLIERLLILTPNDVVRPTDLPPYILDPETPPPTKRHRRGAPNATPAEDAHAAAVAGAETSEEGNVSLAELEKRHLIAVLRQQKGNKVRSAKILGINVKTLYNKIKAYELTDEVEALRK